MASIHARGAGGERVQQPVEGLRLRLSWRCARVAPVAGVGHVRGWSSRLSLRRRGSDDLMQGQGDAVTRTARRSRAAAAIRVRAVGPAARVVSAVAPGGAGAGACAPRRRRAGDVAPWPAARRRVRWAGPPRARGRARPRSADGVPGLRSAYRRPRTASTSARASAASAGGGRGTVRRGRHAVGQLRARHPLARASGGSVAGAVVRRRRVARRGDVAGAVEAAARTRSTAGRRRHLRPAAGLVAADRQLAGIAAACRRRSRPAVGVVTGGWPTGSATGCRRGAGRIARPAPSTGSCRLTGVARIGMRRVPGPAPTAGCRVARMQHVSPANGCGARHRARGAGRRARTRRADPGPWPATTRRRLAPTTRSCRRSSTPAVTPPPGVSVSVTSMPCRRASRPTTNRPSTSVGARSRRSRRVSRAFSSASRSGGHAEAVVDDGEAGAAAPVSAAVTVTRVCGGENEVAFSISSASSSIRSAMTAGATTISSGTSTSTRV